MGKALRALLLALGFSLLLGLSVGTCIRSQAERPAHYIGSAGEATIRGSTVQ